MSFYYFFKMLGDISIICAVANSFLVSFKCNVSSLLPVVILSLCGALGHYLTYKKEALRYLAILPMPLILFIGKVNIATGIALFIAAAYTAACIILLRFQLDHEERRGFFGIGCGALFVCLLVRSFLLASLSNGPLFVPFILVFLFSTLLLTQALRHDEPILRQAKFRLISAGCFLLLLAVIAFVSSPVFISMLLAVAGFIYKWLLSPILLVIACTIGVLVWLPTLLLPDIATQTLEEALLNFFGRYVEDGPKEPQDITAGLNFMFILKIVIGVVILVLVVMFFMRMFKKRKSYRSGRFTKISRQNITQSRNFPEEHIFDGPKAPKDPRNAVRYYYRRFLDTYRNIGLPIDNGTTSAMIEHAAKNVFSINTFAAIGNIRKTYIKARYSSHEVTEDDVKNMKTDCEYVADNDPCFVNEIYDSITDEERAMINSGFKVSPDNAMMSQGFATIPTKARKH